MARNWEITRDEGEYIFDKLVVFDNELRANYLCHELAELFGFDYDKAKELALKYSSNGKPPTAVADKSDDALKWLNHAIFHLMNRHYGEAQRLLTRAAEILTPAEMGK